MCRMERFYDDDARSLALESITSAPRIMQRAVHMLAMRSSHASSITRESIQFTEKSATDRNPSPLYCPHPPFLQPLF